MKIDRVLRWSMALGFCLGLMLPLILAVAGCDLRGVP
jgi:hypothetical protein